MFAWHYLLTGFSNTVGLAICSLFVSNMSYGALLFICALASFAVALAVVKDPPFLHRAMDKPH